MVLVCKTYFPHNAVSPRRTVEIFDFLGKDELDREKTCHGQSSCGPKRQNLDQLMHTVIWEWYSRGEDVERNVERSASFHKKAAMRGHPEARHNLGYYERHLGNQTALPSTS